MAMPSPQQAMQDMTSGSNIDAIGQSTTMSVAGPIRSRVSTAPRSHSTETSPANFEVFPRKPEQQGNETMPNFNINLSSENDRIALTRYTHQALTSLAAYRDALIDENGRLNAMIMRAQAGLELSNDDTATERLVDGNIGREDEDQAGHANRRRYPSALINIVRDGMKEELQHLRSKAVQLKQEEDSLPGGPAGKRSVVASDSTTPEDPTMIMYYSIVNKVQSDLDNSKSKRADAIAELASTARHRPEKAVRQPRTAIRGALDKNPSCYGESSDVNGRSPSHANGTQRLGSVGNSSTVAMENQIDSILSFLTDQEEAVWQRERSESEMEKALRDLRCYVEAMIREWRDIGDLPPPGKYQTISYPSLNLPYIPTQIFPKRKGRPPRTSVKVQQIPEGLQHLLFNGRMTRAADKIEKERRGVREKDRPGRTKPDSNLTACQIADALVARRNRERQAKARALEMGEVAEDPARKRRRMLLERHMEYADDSAGSVPASIRNGSISGPHTDMLHVAANSPNRHNQSLSPDQLYGATASAINDAMQAYTQPMQDETSVFGAAEETYESPEEPFDNQIPYQVQLAQRRGLGYSADLHVPETLVNGGNVFDNPDDMQLGSGTDRQTELQTGSVEDFAQSNPFRPYHQATQESVVEGLIQEHIRSTQTSDQQTDNTLMQLQHVEATNLEVADAQQALDQYRFEDALMNHDMNETEDQQSGSLMAPADNGESANDTAIAAQRLMNSLAPQADPDFDTACQNCGRRDTSAWRKLTVDGVDYKVCNPCGLHYQKNGVMRPKSLWGDVAAEPRRRRSQRPFGSNLPSEQEHDILMDDTLYQTNAEQDGEAFPESSAYDTHYPDTQYGLDGQTTLTADSPPYELSLEQ